MYGRLYPWEIDHPPWVAEGASLTTRLRLRGRALSSAVRAFGLHPKGRPFDPVSAHGRVRTDDGESLAVDYFRDVSVQAMGTVIGGVVLIVGAQIGGLLAGVDWGQVWKSTGVSLVIALVGLAGTPFVLRKDRRARDATIARAKREGWYGEDMR